MTSSPLTPTIDLIHGTGDAVVAMPRFGYGVYKVPPEEAQRCVAEALAVGYRSIDTAALYGNEEGVGRAIAQSGLPREEIFVTTKVWNDAQGYDATLEAFEASRARLGLDYVDLYLVHWPQPARDLYVETWRAVLTLRTDGRIRAAGVSNFNPAHLDRVRCETGESPALDQVELHPYLTQQAVRAYAAEHGVVVESWGPLARGRELLDDAVLMGIAREHGATPAQVVLAWHRQRGLVAIPKSVTPERIRENFASLDVALTDAQLAAIDGLDRGGRTGPDPETFND